MSSLLVYSRLNAPVSHTRWWPSTAEAPAHYVLPNFLDEYAERGNENDQKRSVWAVRAVEHGGYLRSENGKYRAYPPGGHDARGHASRQGHAGEAGGGSRRAGEKQAYDWDGFSPRRS